MDNIRAPGELATAGIAARLPYRGPPGLVTTAAGRTRKSGALPQSRAGRERAA